MNEDFVTYELAKKLKEKGFKEKCIAYYWEKINEHTPSFVVEDNMPEDGLCLLDLLSNHNQAEWSPFIDAPTISQVLKWLREEHKIYMYVERDTYHLKFRFVYEKDKPRGVFTSSVYDKFEQAALAGIEYVIDNLI